MTIAVDLLPQADGLFDPSGLTRELANAMGEVPVSITIERTHFPGNRPIQHVLCGRFRNGRTETLFAECCPVDPMTHADRVRASLTKSRNGQKSGYDGTAIVLASELGMVLRRPGLDERLPGLRLLHDPAFARVAVRRVLGHDFGPVTAELVAHRLGKRAVLRIRGVGLNVFVRLRAIKSGEGDARLKLHRSLWQSLSDETALRIPKPLGGLPEIGAAFFAVLPGRPADFQSQDASAVARAIAALQRLDPHGLPVHSGTDEARILLQWFERCKTGRPDLVRKIAPGLTCLIAKLELAANSLRPCHRDLHEKQVLVSGGVAGLLDFDTLCLSDPALDVGNLLAHLFFAGQDEEPLRRLIDLPGIGLWRSAALYRLAMIYAFTSTPQSVLDRLIEEADAHADD